MAKHKKYQRTQGFQRRFVWVHDRDWDELRRHVDALNAARGAGRSGMPMEADK